MAGPGKRGGKRKGAGRKKGDKTNRGRAGKSPDQFMNALIPAGPRVDHDEAEYVEAEIVEPREGKTHQEEYVDPVQFCLAVINNDQEILTRCGVIEIPNIAVKIEAARIAVKYTNKPKPVETISKHQFSWVDEITEAENRLKTLRKDQNDDDGAAN